MGEELLVQDLSGIVSFGNLRIQLYLRMAADHELLCGISSKQAIDTLEKAFDGYSARSQDPKDEEKIPQMLQHWMEAPDPSFVGMAELHARFNLTADDIEILAFLSAIAIEPALRELCQLVVGTQSVTTGLVCRILSHADLASAERYLSRLAYDMPLRRYALVTVSQRSNNGFDRNLSDREIIISDRTLDFIRNPIDPDFPVDESLASFACRMRDAVSLEKLYLPQHCQTAILQMIRSQAMPALFTGPHGAGKEQIANAVATMLGRSLLSVDLASLLVLSADVMNVRIAEVFREARLGNDFIYLRGVQLPAQISGAHQIVLQKSLMDEQCLVGAETVPEWLNNIASAWTQISIPMPGLEHRIALWTDVFENDKRSPGSETIEAVARRYEMTESQIRQAASEARRQSIAARRKRVDLNDLDKACRIFFTHKLSDIAELVPPSTFKPEQLILPETEREKFDEVLLYAKSHDTIYSEWGFGDQDAQGRGLSVLFYGPPGTGKSMAASIIANVLGLDIFRIDLSRLIGIGDSDSRLAKVFDEAERGHAMLLFEEVDALFEKRSSGKSTAERVVSFDCSYLLQRIENFEGVTVLTTNTEAVIDDTFKRHIRYRINFPMPDAETRERLFKALIPPRAPVKKNIPFDLLGNHFEISGGYIKQTVLKAAFYAKRDNTAIGLSQLTEAAIAECRKLGMLMNDNLPQSLTNAIRAEKGLPALSEEEYRRIHRPVISQDLPLLDLPEGIPIPGAEDDDYR